MSLSLKLNVYLLPGLCLISSMLEQLMPDINMPVMSIILVAILTLNIRNLKITRSQLAVFLLIAIYNTILIFDQEDLLLIVRSQMSLLLFWSGAFLGSLFCKSSERQQSGIYILIFIVILSLLSERISGVHGRTGGLFFQEPSHLALYLAPLLLFIYFQGKYFWFLMATFATYALSPSSTLIICIFGPLIIYRAILYKGNFKYFSVLVIVSTLSFIFFVSDSFQDRILGLASGSDNLSSLVWLNGWSSAFDYLMNSNYFGVGFNLMGFGVDPSVIGAYSDVIYEASGGYLNYNDGSFLVSKVLAETGILGLLLLGYVLFYAFDKFKDLYKNRKNIRPEIHLALAIFLVASVSMFVRGFGYFSPIMFMFIWSISYIHKMRYVS